MRTSTGMPTDLAERGQKFYDEQLKALLEPSEIGKFVAIEPYLERYFVAARDIEALQAARAALPDKVFFLVRIGYEAAHKISGARMLARAAKRHAISGNASSPIHRGFPQGN